MSVASLGMYDHPRQRDANDALWSTIARTLRLHGIDAPQRLDRDRPVESIWRDGDLLLAQACGYPLIADPDLDLRVIAVPSYAVAVCPPARHRSHIVVHADSAATSLAGLRGSVAAINATSSNSGANLLRAAVAPLANGLAFFRDIRITGSHRASIDAVATGQADLAAIDAVTFAAIERFEPDAVATLRILADTRSSPALPFVTARSTPPATCAALREALRAAMHDPDIATERELLFLSDIVPATGHRYGEVAKLHRDAATLGYPDLV